MTAIQLELFRDATKMATGATPVAPRTQPKDDDSKFIMTVNLYDTDGHVYGHSEIDVTMTLDPCRSCPFREFCDEEECGQKLYDIDAPMKDYTPFDEWLSDPLY